jgi:hypothetical protein
MSLRSRNDTPFPFRVQNVTQHFNLNASETDVRPPPTERPPNQLGMFVAFRFACSASPMRTRHARKFQNEKALRRVACSHGARLAVREIVMNKTLEDSAAIDQHLSRSLSLLVRRIEGEYDEMPGLTLTEAQARRLWGLDPTSCREVLVTLTRSKFLRRTADGLYVRAAV